MKLSALEWHWHGLCYSEATTLSEGSIESIESRKASDALP